MTKRTLLLMGCLCYALFSVAQSVDAELENKYFLARNRLKKWFVTVNQNPGSGLMTDNIKLNPPGWEKDKFMFDHFYRLANGTDSFISDTAWNSNLQTNTENTTLTGWSRYDNPLIMTGQYLQVLATEYWLLKYYGKQNTEEFTACKNEMYYVLMAIDRLDGSSEKYFNPAKPNSINGFMRRDDSDWDKGDRINKYYGFYGHKLGDLPMILMNNVEGIMPDTSFKGIVQNKREVWIDSMVFITDTINGITDTLWLNLGRDSTFYTLDTGHFYYKNNYRIGFETNAHPLRSDGLKNHCSGREGNEPSVDEYIGIFIGLKYIQKFVDEDAQAQPLIFDSSKYLVQWTREIAHRMMTYLSKRINNIPVFEPFSKPKNLIINPILFDAGNYVLYNPAKSDQVVHRGINAYPFGYPIEKLGEQLASSSSVTRDYPSVSLDFSDDAKKIKRSAKMLSYVLKFNPTFKVASGIADDFLFFKALFDGAETSADDILLIKSQCGLQDEDFINVDKVCNCLVGMKAKPEDPQFWKLLWEKLGDKNSLLGYLWRKYNKNGGSVNIMAAKMALTSGTWSQSDFADFADKCGFPLMSLDYDVINDKTPYFSESFYRDILQTLDCHGSSGIGWPFDRDAISGAAMKPANRNKDNTYDGSFFAQTPYLIYYNLYRIAQIKYWGDNYKRFNDESCPCFEPSFEAGKRLPYSAVEPEKLVIPVYHPVTGIKIKDSIVYSYANKLIQTDVLVKTKDANPTHARIGVRQPEFLNHYYKVGKTVSGANQTFLVTRDLVVCNSNLEIENGGNVVIDLSTNVNSPNEVTVRKNARLTVKNDGTFVVNNNTRLVIDVGGFLEYQQGAHIILNGPNAVLHIKGALELGPNATFQIEGGANGKGYIIWENNWVQNPPHYTNTVSTSSNIFSNYGASAVLIADATNKVLLTNSGLSAPTYGNKILVCKGNLGFMTGWGLGTLEVKNAKIELVRDSRIVSEAGNTQFNKVEVKGDYNANPLSSNFNKHISMGVHVLGRKNQFTQVYFYDCFIGMKIFNVGTYEPLNLNQVEFHNCFKSIVNEGGRLNANYITIDGNNAIQRMSGIEGIGTQGRSNINYSMIRNPNIQSQQYPWIYRFQTGEYSSGVKSHGTGQYFLLNTTIDSAEKALEMREGFVRPVCSHIKEFKTGVDLLQKATFNPVNKTFNDFYLPSTSQYASDFQFIHGDRDIYVLLSDASNKISGRNGGNAFISTILNPINSKFGQATVPTENWHSHNSYQTKAAGNYWEINNGSETDIWPLNSPAGNTTTAEAWQLIGGNPQSLDYATKPTIDFATYSLDMANLCNIYFQHDGWKPSQSQTDPFQGKPVGDWTGGYTPNIETEVYSMLYVWKQQTGNLPELLNGLVVALDTNVHDTMAAALHEIYVNTQSLYREIFSDTTIPEPNRPATETNVYNTMLGLQNKLIQRSENNDDVWRWFKFELHRDLALIHRSFNHRNDGINHLAQVIPSFNNQGDQESLLAWKCLLEREQMYLDSLVPYDSLFLYGCIPNYYFNDSTVNYTLTGWNPELWGENGGEPNAMAIQTGSQKAANGTTQADVKTNVQTKTNTPPKTTKEVNLALYPNPADNSFTIYCSEAISKVRVTDNAGRLVNTYQVNSKNQITIDASSYSKGIYFVETYSQDKRFTKQLMINR